MHNDNDRLHNVVIVTALVLIAIVLYFAGGRAYRSWRAGSARAPETLRRSVRQSGDERSSPSTLPPMKVKRVEGRPQRDEPPAVPRGAAAVDKRAN